jgi:CTP:molybdopterin cytidylyltransferase MocA
MSNFRVLDLLSKTVLAADASYRLSYPKQFLEFDEVSLIRRTFLAVANVSNKIFVVLGQMRNSFKKKS